MAVPLRDLAAPPRADASPALRPVLRLGDVIALIIGTVVGAGIFKTPSLVAANAGTPQIALGAWVVGGLVSLVGAACYAELAAAYPHPGGDYHYQRLAFGPRVGFLFAWARLMVIQTGSIALLAFVFGDYASELLGLGPRSAAFYAAGLVVVLTAVNLWGVRRSKRAQNVLTVIEVVGVIAIAIAGVTVGDASLPALSASAPLTGGTLGLVMVFVLVTFGGWNEAAYLSAEVRDPGRTMARALIGGLLIVTVLYVAVNWAYLSALGLAGVAGSPAVAADVMRLALGEHGARLVSVLIAVAAITSANAAIFTGARTSFAVGRDFPTFGFLARWNRTKGTPTGALLVQGVVCLALVALGARTRNGFETMVEYTAPVFWLFLFVTGVALFVLRWREPGTPRPFRVPFYPVTPILFCATCAWLFYSSLAYTGLGALVGLAVLLAGVVLLAVSSRASNHPSWRFVR